MLDKFAQPERANLFSPALRTALIHSAQRMSYFNSRSLTMCHWPVHQRKSSAMNNAHAIEESNDDTKISPEDCWHGGG